MFEERMAALEGAEAARATAPGMAAVTASLLGQLRAGDHVSPRASSLGPTKYVFERLLPRVGIASTLVDGTSSTSGRGGAAPTRRRSSSRRPNEPDPRPRRYRRRPRSPTPPAPSRRRQRLRHAAPAAAAELGADFVVYSATKHVDGQGRCLGGIVLGSETSSRSTCTTTCARPAPRSARSMPG